MSCWTRFPIGMLWHDSLPSLSPHGSCLTWEASVPFTCHHSLRFLTYFRVRSTLRSLNNCVEHLVRQRGKHRVKVRDVAWTSRRGSFCRLTLMKALRKASVLKWGVGRRMGGKRWAPHAWPCGFYSMSHQRAWCLPPVLRLRSQTVTYVPNGSWLWEHVLKFLNFITYIIGKFRG